MLGAIGRQSLGTAVWCNDGARDLAGASGLDARRRFGDAFGERRLGRRIVRCGHARYWLHRGNDV